MNSLSPKEAASLLRQKDNILILTHRRPDGDTAGCAWLCGSWARPPGCWKILT